MLARLRLEEEEEHEDCENLTWGGLRVPLGLNGTLPDDLVDAIIWKHLDSQPLRRRFELTLVSPRFREFLTKGRPSRESCVLAPNCLQKVGCKHRENRTVCWGADDVLQKREMPIPLHPPSPKLPLCTDPSCKESRWKSLDGWSVSSCQGGEPGLIYLLKSSASASASASAPGSGSSSIASASHGRGASPSIAEWLVLNPVTESRRQLPLDYQGKVPEVRMVDRFSSGYLSWASDDGGERMYPLLLDLESNAWKRIGSGFVTRGRIRMDKAVRDDTVILLYEKYDLMDLLITYDLLQGSFREEMTTGLADNICDEYLFHFEGHVYLAAVLCYPSTGRWVEKSVVIYELEPTGWNWTTVSVSPPWLSNRLTEIYPALVDLKFLQIDHELVLARLGTERKTDGIHVILSSEQGNYPCVAVAAFDLSARSWRREEMGRFGPKLDSLTSVFRPRLDIEA